MQSRRARRCIHHVRACTRGKPMKRGREYNGAGRHAGFVYPLARPCVISPGSILSTGTQFSRARCSFEFRFPAFARPVDLYVDLSIPRSPFLLPFHPFFARSPALAFPSFYPFDPRHSFISSRLPPRTSLRICYSVYFSLVPFRRPIQRMNILRIFPRSIFVA